MYNVISFSVWGNDPLYHNGILENAKLVPEVYPNWVCRVYHDEKFPRELIHNLKSMGVKTFLRKMENNWYGLLSRFEPAGDSAVDTCIVRDADSRLTIREKVCVDEWLKSDKAFHCMRDHIEHNVPIMGGMWGSKKGFIKDFSGMLSSAKAVNKGDDQVFLSQQVWPKIREKALVHDRFHKGIIRFEDELIEWDNVSEYYDDYNARRWVDNVLVSEDQYPHGKIVLKDGRVLDRDKVYEYQPLKLFGEHDIRPFPEHGPMKFGTYVGEIVR